MSPILALALAGSITQAEPTREHAQLLAAAIELHAAIRTAQPAAAAIDAERDCALRYDFVRGAARHADAPDVRPPVAYSLASPVFRDLL